MGCWYVLASVTNTIQQTKTQNLEPFPWRAGSGLCCHYAQDWVGPRDLPWFGKLKSLTFTLSLINKKIMKLLVVDFLRTILDLALEVPCFRKPLRGKLASSSVGCFWSYRNPTQHLALNLVTLGKLLPFFAGLVYTSAKQSWEESLLYCCCEY